MRTLRGGREHTGHRGHQGQIRVLSQMWFSNHVESPSCDCIVKFDLCWTFETSQGRPLFSFPMHATHEKKGHTTRTPTSHLVCRISSPLCFYRCSSSFLWLPFCLSENQLRFMCLQEHHNPDTNHEKPCALAQKSLGRGRSCRNRWRSRWPTRCCLYNSKWRHQVLNSL